MYLRPHMIEQATRRVRPSLGPCDPDRALWMVRHLGFCPETWEVLVDRCPGKGCARPFTWPRPEALDRCALCGFVLSERRARKVHRKDRAPLDWLTALFSDCEQARAVSFTCVPPEFDVASETDVYELVLAFARTAYLLRAKGDAATEWSHQDVAAGARFLLDYPRSRWDALQQLDPGERPRLYALMSQVGRNSPVPVVQNAIRMVLVADRDDVTVVKHRTIPSPGAMSVTGVATLFGVERGSIRRLTDAGLLKPIHTSGTERQQSLFAEREMFQIRKELDRRMSWRAFSITTRLPQTAIEQLLALGRLMPLEYPIAEALYGDRQLERKSAGWISGRLNALPLVPETGQWMSLEQAFAGVGGREKPWSAILDEGLAGRFPGGLYRDESSSSGVGLVVHPTVARGLIMGGPGAQPWYRFDTRQYGAFQRGWMSPGEVQVFLNCSSVDLAWLVETGRLKSMPRAERTRFSRADVETISRDWMTTREAAARLGIAAKEVWRVLEAHDVRASIGQGFHQRAILEQVVAEEVRAQ